MSATKVGENITNISKLLFFTINLQFVTSNQISTYRKLNLPLTGSIYLVFFPLQIQKKLNQIKACHVLFYVTWKETTHKPLKLAAAKRLFSSVYIIGTTCFNECFSVYVLTKTLLFVKDHRYSDTFLNVIFKASVLKEVVFCINVFYALSPH